MNYLHKIWHDDAERVSEVFLAAKNFNFKNLLWQTTAILKLNNSRYFMITQNGSVKHIGCQPSWIFDTKFLTDMQLTDTFCIVLTNFVYIDHITAVMSRLFMIVFFLVKCKNSLNDCAWHGVTSSSRDNWIKFSNFACVWTYNRRVKFHVKLLEKYW